MKKPGSKKDASVNSKPKRKLNMLPAKKSVISKPATELSPAQKFGTWLKIWRRRAGLTTGAGVEAFTRRNITDDSAKRKWREYEKGAIAKIDLKEVEVLIAAVKGNLWLAKAIIGFDSDPLHPSVFNLIGDQTNEEEFIAEGAAGETKTVCRESAREKARKADQSLRLKNDFLINGRGRGTSLEYMIDLSAAENKLDPDEERNRILETFFDKYINIAEETRHNALQDFWLAIFQRGEMGAALLRELIEFYEAETKSETVADRKFSFLNKYAVHFATNVLFYLYSTFYDPLDPQAADKPMPPDKIEEFSDLKNLILHGKIEDMINYMPSETQQKFKKAFTKSIYFFDNDSDFVVKLKTSSKEYEAAFEKLAQTAIVRLYELEKRLYYLAGKTSKRKTDGESFQLLMVDLPVTEKHVLFRLYKLCTAKEFLGHLWLMEETLELYRIRYKELNPGKEVSYKLL